MDFQKHYGSISLAKSWLKKNVKRCLADERKSNYFMKAPKLEHYIDHWQLSVSNTLFTPTSELAFGERNQLPVLLKIPNSDSDEVFSSEALKHFAGHGSVRCFDTWNNGLLLERAVPGHDLESMSLSEDHRATQIIAEVISKLDSSGQPNNATCFTTLEAWQTSFDRYIGGCSLIPQEMVALAKSEFNSLCDSQTEVVLLHADLHHKNILFDKNRGWLAIDPKGVIGEPAIEVCAALRNPLKNKVAIEKLQTRAKIFSHYLKLDYQRIMRWCFALAVLSALWFYEDDIVGAAFDTLWQWRDRPLIT